MGLSADAFETSVFSNHIAGVQTPAENGDAFTSVNPTTGREWGSLALSAKADVDRAVSAAHNAFSQGPWSSFADPPRSLDDAMGRQDRRERGDNRENRDTAERQTARGNARAGVLQCLTHTQRCVFHRML
jgi:hypothetical protein